jgi:hypothetical protein
MKRLNKRVAQYATVHSLEEAVLRYVAMHIRALLLVILAGCTGSGLLGHGQGTSASLTGNVTDSSGAVVSGATVTITNVDADCKDRQRGQLSAQAVAYRQLLAAH